MLGDGKMDENAEVSVRTIHKGSRARGGLGSLGARNISSPRLSRQRKSKAEGSGSSLARREPLPGIASRTNSPMAAGARAGGGRGKGRQSQSPQGGRSPLRPSEGGHAATSSRLSTSPRTSPLASPMASPRLSSRGGGDSAGRSTPSPTKVHRLPALAADPHGGPPCNRRLHAPHLTHRRSRSDHGMDQIRTKRNAGGDEPRSRGGRGSRSAQDDSAVSSSRGGAAVDREALRSTYSMPPSKFRDSVHVHRARAQEPKRPVSDGIVRSASSSPEHTAAAAAAPATATDTPDRRSPVKQVVCFEQVDGVVYPNSSRVTPLRQVKQATARSRRSNTHAKGRSCLKPRRCPSPNERRPESVESETGMTAMTSLRIALAEDSGVAAKLAEGGFTLTHCDDPDQKQDPLEAAQDARERALDLRRELDADMSKQ
mmetsp:Transcript_20596/g.53540  ORF Transcript_20596/g.53540 Transcript_20596/m.53540 type:complete len:428 (+) Transcript_20596:238-1521(+)